jgi:hypothetical protein
VHLLLSGPFQYLVDLDMYVVDGVERRQKGQEENTGDRLEGKEQGADLSLSHKKRLCTHHATPIVGTDPRSLSLGV